MDKESDMFSEWTGVGSELIPTKKGKAYEAIFETWIRMKATPYKFGDNLDLKAVHWVMSGLTRRSIAMKYECRTGQVVQAIPVPLSFFQIMAWRILMRYRSVEKSTYRSMILER